MDLCLGKRIMGNFSSISNLYLTSMCYLHNEKNQMFSKRKKER